MFPERFRRRLQMGAYTHWAADLNAAHLEALLWMVGEYGCRAPLVLDLIEKHKDDFTIPGEGSARATLALETIFRIVRGERLTVNEATRRVRELLHQLRSAPEGPGETSGA